MIITGAPVEMMDFTEVKYWDELTQIFEYCKTNVQSTIFICWGAQAALHYYYGLDKYTLDKKLFGVFKHHKFVRFDPLLKGTDEEFYIPHSRHTSVRYEDIENVPDLSILAGSRDVGASVVRSVDGRQIFLMGHMEYDRDTLKKEYLRDVDKGLDNVPLPYNYFPEDNPENTPVFSWRCTANLMFSNWLNYCVYQRTPYNLDELEIRSWTWEGEY
jgi:homoserine O-succinyltransferase